MRTILWIVGEPGLGKSSLVRALLPAAERGLVEKPKWTVAGRWCAAGHYTGGKFDGADTIPYNGAAAALDFWAAALGDKTVTILDGDRFSNASSVAQVHRLAPGARLRCVHLKGPPGLAAARRAQRGTAQNETWLRGRVTKAANFAASFPADRRLVLDAALTSEEIAWMVRGWLGT